MSKVPEDNKQLRIYDKNGQYTRLSVDETIARGYNSWKGWKCSAGVRGLYIDYDGNIWNGNCASSYRNYMADYSKVKKTINDKWREYRENIIGADGSELRKQWLNKNTEGGWPMPKTNWKNSEQQQKLMAEIDRLETEFFRKIDVKQEPDAWEWKSTLDDIPDNWGLLGNIRQGVNFPETYTVCPFDNCGCGADVILSKAKNNKFLDFLDVTKNGIDGTLKTDNNVDSIQSEPVAVEMNFEIPHQILWDISRRCNYSCNYCWPGVHSKTALFPDLNQTRVVIDMLADHWAMGKQIRWNFGGGEPTMHKDFLEILKHLKIKNQWVLVTSNGSRSNKFWKEAVKYINSVNMSAHFASMDEIPGNEDRFLENCKTIMEHHDAVDGDHWLEIKLMTPPGYLDRARQLQDRILSLDMLHKPGANNRVKGSLSLVPIRGLTDSSQLMEYSDNELEFFKQQ